MVDWRLHIETKPDRLYGKPVIINTRIPVNLILEKLASGDSMNDLLEAYPKLNKDDLIACLLFAAESIQNDVVDTETTS